MAKLPHATPARPGRAARPPVEDADRGLGPSYNVGLDGDVVGIDRDRRYLVHSAVAAELAAGDPALDDALAVARAVQ